MCPSQQHQPSAVSRLRLTTQKMAKNFMMTLKEGHLKLTWITHKIFSLVLVHLKMQDIRHHYFSLRPNAQCTSYINTNLLTYLSFIITGAFLGQ